MDEGKAHANAGDLSHALEAYSSAHELMHVPTTGIAVAKTQAALGKLVEARATAKEVAASPRADHEPPVFADARQKAKDLETELYGRIPTLQMDIQGGTPTRVTIDGAVILDAQLAEPIPVNPGDHAVLVTGSGGFEKRFDVTVKEGEVRKIPIEIPTSSAGPRRVLGDGPPPEEPHEGRSGAATAMIYGGFGLAAVGAAVGAVTGAMTFSKASVLGPKCDNNKCAPSAKSDLDSANTLATVSTVGFIAAGAGVVLGVIGLVMPSSSSTEPSKDAALNVHVGLDGAGLSGTF